MEIVKFKNGKFGIRRTIKRLFKKPRYEFLDSTSWIWRPEGDKKWCYFDSYQDAVDYIDNGEVVPQIMRAKK